MNKISNLIPGTIQQWGIILISLLLCQIPILMLMIILKGLLLFSILFK